MIDNLTLQKHMIAQIILTMWDAASHLWPAVRAAYENSTQDIEECNLTWNYSTQWAINRFSASQAALSNIQIVPRSVSPLSTGSQENLLFPP